MNDPIKYECCKSFTEIALETNMIKTYANEPVEETALRVATFFNTLLENLDKQE